MRPLTKVVPVDGYKVLIPGDIHGGIQDDDVLGLLTEIGEKEKVDALVLIGDTHDCSGVSPYRTNVDKYLSTLEDEDEAIEWFVEDFKDQGCEVFALAGNHERWVLKFLAENPGLGKNLKWHSMFPRTYKGVKCLPYAGMLKIGSLLFEHGHELNGALSILSAKTVWSRYPGQNTLYGHTHRQDQWVVPTSKDGIPVMHGAWTIGHCSIPEKHRDYAAQSLSSWVQGGALVEWYKLPTGELHHRVNTLSVFRDKRNRPYICYNGNLYR